MMSIDTRLSIINKCRKGEPLTILEEELFIKDVMKHVRNERSSSPYNSAISYVRNNYGDCVVIKYRSLSINVNFNG